MLQIIRNHTVAHGKIDEPLYDVSVNELYAFISLQLACGILVGKNTSISDLWNKQWGLPIFSKKMARDRSKSIMQHMRFDTRGTRRQHLLHDKFCLISQTWDAFITNCQRCYVPNCYLTIDEQLFPCKSHCSFMQYIASKPDKLGIKFWLLVDVKNKYFFNTLSWEKIPHGQPVLQCLKMCA